MKYFGQYLVSKGMISEEVLVDALLEQLLALPAIVEVVRKKSLLTPSALLSAFALQSDKQLEFKQACRELGSWTPAIDDAVKKELESLRIPLGQILIKRGAIDLHAMTKALDEFLSRVEEKPVHAEAPVVEAPVAAEPLVKEKEPSAESSKTASADAIDSVLLEEFLGFATDERIKGLKDLFVALSQEPRTRGEPADAILKRLFSEFRSLRGLLKFVRLERTEAFVARTEVLIFKAIEQVGRNDAHLLPALSESGQAVVALLEALKGGLAQGGSEAPLLEHSEWGPKVEALFKRFTEIFEQEKIKGES